MDYDGYCRKKVEEKTNNVPRTNHIKAEGQVETGRYLVDLLADILGAEKNKKIDHLKYNDSPEELSISKSNVNKLRDKDWKSKGWIRY